MADKKNGRRKKGGFFLLLGFLFLFSAVFLTAWNLYRSFRAEYAAESEAAAILSAMEENGEDAENADDGGDEPEEFPDEVSDSMPILTVNGKDYIGILYFESLDLTLPVYAEWNYENLETGPCRFTGTIASNNLVICGHNYLTQFSRIKKLPEGTEVVFTDVLGVQYIYTLLSRETVQPTAVEDMVDNSTGWDMTLFTCNTGGQTRCALRFKLTQTLDADSSAYIFSLD